MESNATFVQKAILAGDALATQGKLLPAQSDKFIDYVVDETVWKRICRILRFRNETWQAEKISVGRRVTVPFEEARDPGIRRGVTTSKVTITPSEFMVPVEVSMTAEDVNIEGMSFTEHVIRMFASQLQNDLESLFWFGNPLGPAVLESDLVDGGSTTLYVKDTFLAKQTGWFLSADSGNSFDVDGAPIGSKAWHGTKRTMPTKFQSRGDLRWITSWALYDLWLESLSNRSGVLGDAITAGRSQALTPAGVPAETVPLIPLNPLTVEHKTFTGAGSTVTLKFKNVLAGSIVVTPSTLGSVPTAAYALTTDYTVDEAAGTVTQVATGSIGATATVKITYYASPQILLTPKSNLVVGFGRDISVLRDQSIYQRVHQFAMHVKVGCTQEENTAISKGKNVADEVA